MLYSKRSFLFALAGTVALAGCNFTPVYGPGTSANKMQNRIKITEPTTRETFLITQHLESRLGRADAAPMSLSFSVSHGVSGLGATATGGTTRYHRDGTANYTLTHSETEEKLASGSVRNFTGYSATGNTAATLAAEQDSVERLMTILADMMIERLLLLDAETLP